MKRIDASEAKKRMGKAWLQWSFYRFQNGLSLVWKFLGKSWIWKSLLLCIMGNRPQLIWENFVKFGRIVFYNVTLFAHLTFFRSRFRRFSVRLGIFYKSGKWWKIGVHELNEFAIPRVNSAVGSGTPCCLRIWSFNCSCQRRIWGFNVFHLPLRVDQYNCHQSSWR